MSQAVGASGKVFALDANRNLVEHMKRRFHDARLNNVEVQVLRHDDPGLEPGSVDRVLIVALWHHLHDRVAYGRKLRSARVGTHDADTRIGAYREAITADGQLRSRFDPERCDESRKGGGPLLPGRIVQKEAGNGGHQSSSTRTSAPLAPSKHFSRCAQRERWHYA